MPLRATNNTKTIHLIIWSLKCIQILGPIFYELNTLVMWDILKGFNKYLFLLWVSNNISFTTFNIDAVYISERFCVVCLLMVVFILLWYWELLFVY